MKLSGSILSIKDDKKNNISKMDRSSIDLIHLDIMDGEFVLNETLSYEEIALNLENTNKELDIHLMVSDVKKYIDIYSPLSPKYITFHLEVDSDIFEIIDYIKSKNIKVGISIKPNTDVSLLIPYLGLIDLVLIMSVEPGLGGQKFLDSSISKVNYLFDVRNNYNYSYVIEVDGGINDETSKLVSNADILVVGSYITDSEDYQKQIDQILKGE